MKKYQSNNESPKQEQLKNTEILFDTIKIAFKEIASNKSTERMQEQYKLYKRTGLEIKGKTVYNDNFIFYNSIYKEVMAFASYYISNVFNQGRTSLYKCFDFFMGVIEISNFTYEENQTKLSLIILVDSLYHLSTLFKYDDQTMDNFNILFSFLEITKTKFNDSLFDSIVATQQKIKDEINAKKYDELFGQRKLDITNIYLKIIDKECQEEQNNNQQNLDNTIRESEKEEKQREPIIKNYKIDLSTVDVTIKRVFLSFTITNFKKLKDDLNNTLKLIENNDKMDMQTKYKHNFIYEYPNLFPEIIRLDE